MVNRIAFVDDMLAARDFATGDVVRRMGYREILPGPFTGWVIYSNPRTGKVHVQWPWGAEEEPATELIRDLSGITPPNLSLHQWYPVWEGSRHVNDKSNRKNDEKWRKSLSSEFKDNRIVEITEQYYHHTFPVWKAACKCWYNNLDEISAFKRIASQYSDTHGLSVISEIVSDLYTSAVKPNPRLALYWFDGNRRYRVTKREKSSNQLLCPHCKSPMKSRVYRKQKKCLQCRNPECGFTISPKDLVWDNTRIDIDNTQLI